MYFTQKFVNHSESGCYKENIELLNFLRKEFNEEFYGMKNCSDDDRVFFTNMEKMFKFTEDRLKQNVHTDEKECDYVYKKMFFCYLVESYRQKISEEVGFWYDHQDNRKFWQNSLHKMNQIFHYNIQGKLLVEECNKRKMSKDEKEVIYKHFETEIL